MSSFLQTTNYLKKYHSILPGKKIYNVFHARKVWIFNLLMYNPGNMTNMFKLTVNCTDICRT